MAAGLVPLFTSAPRIRLYINDKPAAYAIGFNVNIAIDIQPVQIIGQFASVSLEPIMYNVVTGTLQIIKLVSKTTQAFQAKNIDPTDFAAAAFTGGVADAAPQFATTAANGNTTQTSDINAVVGNDSNSVLSLNGLSAHLDPNKVLLSRTFDMDLYLTIPTAAAIAAAQATATENTKTAGLALSSWFRIQYCRLTSRNTNISAGQLINEPCNFQGLLATPTSGGTSDFSLDTGVVDKFGSV